MAENDELAGIAVKECLNTLSISSLSEWDVLVFLYRHQSSLANAEQIGRLLGYPGKTVADALDRLEAEGLLERSRASQGIRLYTFAPSAAHLATGSCFQQLIGLAANRSGRLLLVKHLRRSLGLHMAARGKQSG